MPYHLAPIDPKRILLLLQEYFGHADNQIIDISVVLSKASPDFFRGRDALKAALERDPTFKTISISVATLCEEHSFFISLDKETMSFGAPLYDFDGNHRKHSLSWIGDNDSPIVNWILIREPFLESENVQLAYDNAEEEIEVIFSGDPRNLDIRNEILHWESRGKS